MIISVQDLFDEPLFSHMTDPDCEAYLWWESRVNNTFLSVFTEWINDPVYDDFNTTTVLITFWDNIQPATRIQMLDKVKSSPGCCRMIYARVANPVGIGIPYLTTHGASDGTDMGPATQSRERLLKAQGKV